MSIKVNINDISDKKIEKINEELKLIIPSNSNIYPDKIIQPYDLINDYVYLPFYFSINELKLRRPDRVNYPSMNVKFEGELRDEQKKIKSEAIKYLTKNGSVIISLYTGGGKTATSINMACNIKLKTLVIVNKVVLIKQWEKSILDFCPSAKVQKLTPKSEMKDADFYIMNAMNIEKMGKLFFKDIGLCIVDECLPGNTRILIKNNYETIENIYKKFIKGENQIVKTFNEKENIFEYKNVINAKKISLNKNMVQISFYNGNRKIKSTDNHKFLTKNGYIEAQYLKQNDLIISYSENFLQTDILRALNNDQIQIILGCFLGNGYINTLQNGINKLSVIHPPHKKKYCQWKASIFGKSIKKVNYFNKVFYKFTTNFFDFENIFSLEKRNCPDWIINSIDERALAIWYMDNGLFYKNGNYILFSTNFFNKKSIIKIINRLKDFKIESELKLYKNKYYIYINTKNTISFIKLIYPYLHEILKFYKNKFQPQNKLIYTIQNYKILFKKNLCVYRWNSKYLNFGYLKIKSIYIDKNPKEKYVYDIEVEDNHNFIITNKYGLNGPVVHNCHLIVAETLVKSLKYIYPRYLIGLSATPYRNDGLNKMLDFYFGENKIIREMNRKHIVYKVETGINIPNEKTEQGRVNWGSVLKYQSQNIERNELIIKIIKYFSDRNFLILCKRVEQATYIFENLKKSGESVDNLIGSKQTFDKDSRILVGIHQKISVGFDHPKLDTLLLATDLDAYFIQSLGRIFRKQDTIPIVFDLVDSNAILIKHYKNRKIVYNNVGGEIVNFNSKFPDFF